MTDDPRTPATTAPTSSTSPTSGPNPASTDVASGVRGTRTATLWPLVSLSVLVAVVALIFIVQNSQRTKVSFLGWDGSAPLAVLLLCATVLGALLVLLAGAARVIQLRLAARRQRKMNSG
jgi:uncharacterized integral membrane protein